MTTTDSTPSTNAWDAQIEKLRARYKHVRPPILVALNILLHDQNIALDDAKAQAAQHGVKITAASVSAAQRLLSRRDEAPAAVTVIDRTPDGFTAIVQPRRPRATDAPVDAEALIRGVVAKIKGQGNVEADRLRDAMRQAITILAAAVGSSRASTRNRAPSRGVLRRAAARYALRMETAMTMFRTILALPLFACLASAQIITVSGGGAALQNAIVAAPNTAVLVIAPGTYSQVSLSVAKDVTLIAPQGATVDGGLFVGTGGTRRLTVVGLQILPVVNFPQITGGALSTDGHLHAENCAGSGVLAGNASTRSRVYLRGCSFGGVTDSRMRNVDVVLLDSTFTGRSDAGQVGYSALVVTGAGSLRAERVHATGGDGAFAGGVGIEVAASAVFADCTLAAGFSPYRTSVACGGTLTLSNCTLSGTPWPTPILRTVPTASWVSAAWTLGGMSTVRFRENPNELVAVVASLDIAPSTSPLAAETLWIAANPTTFVMSIGVTGTGGDLVAPFTIPNVLALQYTKAWLTGAFFDPLPMRTTCPLGGVIR